MCTPVIRRALMTGSGEKAMRFRIADLKLAMRELGATDSAVPLLGLRRGKREMVEWLRRNLNFEGENAKGCPICLDSVVGERMAPECGHDMHVECGNRLLDSGQCGEDVPCPVCRRSVGAGTGMLEMARPRPVPASQDTIRRISSKLQDFYEDIVAAYGPMGHHIVHSIDDIVNSYEDEVGNGDSALDMIEAEALMAALTIAVADASRVFHGFDVRFGRKAHTLVSEYLLAVTGVDPRLGW